MAVVRRIQLGMAVAGMAVASVVVGITTAGAAGAVAAGAAPVPTPGYWLAGADGGVFSFGAPFHGSGTTVGQACGFSPQPQSTLNAAFGCTAIAATPGGGGYWLLNAYRWATGFGQAVLPAQTGCTSLNGARGTWTGMASSPTGKGFVMTSSNGGVLACGDGMSVGGLATQPLAAPVVGVAVTPDGGGYWLVASDGGVFAFGDASFDGSMGGVPLRAPVVGIAGTPDGRGYWLVASDGGVFAFGSAPYVGSMVGKPMAAPVVGIAASAPRPAV